MKALFLTLILFSSPIFAQKAKVLVVDPNIDTISLEKDFDVERPAKPFTSLPDKGKRDAFLKDIPQVKNWDELEKDIFYMNLKSKHLPELQKKYPSLSKEKLSNLQKKMKEE